MKPALEQPERRRAISAGALALVAATAPGWLAACASEPERTAAATRPRKSDASDIALLNRLTWGVDSQAVRDWSSLGRRDWISTQLHPPAEASLPATAPAQCDASGACGRLMIERVVEMEGRRREADASADDAAKKTAQQAYQQEMNRLARDAASRTLLRALYSPSQLREHLTWFWFNHFNVHQYKANLRVMVGDYEDSLRVRALGKFRDLLVASATHPAMIRYLDNEQNAVNHINENYARELMELHTLGVDGGYSQKDVQELARVLTGLGINFTQGTPRLSGGQQSQYWRQGATEFNPARHDAASKVLLGSVVAGGGWREILDQLARLAAHPATARHVSERLAVYFVADDPPADTVSRMSDAYLASDGDIAATLQAMIDSPPFAASLGTKFKDPVHYVVSAVRLAYDGRTIVNPAPMLGWLNRMGEGLYNRQTPDGYPMDEAGWSGSGQMSTRFEIARAIGSSSAGLFRGEAPGSADAPAFPQLSNALYHERLGATLGPRTRAALDSASSAVEWNVLLLSSPEFMTR
jgi:uncharacterized protein (DUF1800 family)